MEKKEEAEDSQENDLHPPDHTYYYSLLYDFSYPEYYANPANYYISNTQECNDPALKKLLNAKRPSVGNEESVTKDDLRSSGIFPDLKQDKEDNFVDPSKDGKYASIIHIEDFGEETSSSSEGSSCFDNDDLCAADSNIVQSGSDNVNVNADNSSENKNINEGSREDDQISNGSAEISTDDEEQTSTDTDEDISNEELSDDWSSIDEDDDENCLWDWQVEPIRAQQADEEEPESKKKDKEKKVEEVEETKDKDIEIDDGEETEDADEEEQEEVIFQGKDLVPFLKCLQEWKKKEECLMLTDPFLKYLWEWKKYNYKTTRSESFRYKTHRTAYGEPFLQECICEDEIDWSKFKMEDEEEEEEAKTQEKQTGESDESEEGEGDEEDEEHCCDFLIANIEARQMVQSYPIHHMKYLMSGAAWKIAKDQARGSVVEKPNLSKTDINRYYKFNADEMYQKDSIKEEHILINRKPNEVVENYEALGHGKLCVGKITSEEDFSDTESSDGSRNLNDENCSDEDGNGAIMGEESDENLRNKRLIENVLQQVYPTDEGLEKYKHLVNKTIIFEEFDWWIPEQPAQGNVEDLDPMLKMMKQVEAERVYNEQKDALRAHKKAAIWFMKQAQMRDKNLSLHVYFDLNENISYVIKSDRTSEVSENVENEQETDEFDTLTPFLYEMGETKKSKHFLKGPTPSPVRETMKTRHN